MNEAPALCLSLDFDRSFFCRIRREWIHENERVRLNLFVFITYLVELLLQVSKDLKSPLIDVLQ